MGSSDESDLPVWVQSHKVRSCEVTPLPSAPEPVIKLYINNPFLPRPMPPQVVNINRFTIGSDSDDEITNKSPVKGAGGWWRDTPPRPLLLSAL